MYIVYTYAQKNRDSSHGVSAKVCIRILWKHKFATDMDIPCRLLIRMEEYTSRAFHHKLEQAGMTQSMSRVAHCTDNGPMEGFWGILKREMYYKKKFHSREELVSAIVEYIDYYRNDRPQRGLGILTPMEYHDMLMAA